MRTNVLDWDKLRQFVSERKPIQVDAGLLNDWFWTADTVYSNGTFNEEHGAFTQSKWATPGFKATMPNGDTIEVVSSREATEDDLTQSELKLEELRETLRQATEKARQKSNQ